MRRGRTRIWVGQVELATSLVPAPVSRPPRDADETAQLLVRLHGSPLGFIRLPFDGPAVDPAAVARAVEAQLAGPLWSHLDADGLWLRTRLPVSGLGGWDECARAVSAGAAVSVVVCTRNHPAGLERCLRSLQQLRYEPFDVVVVDNAPDDTATRDCFDRVARDDARFRYAVEPTPGLSRARNRGLSLATARYVAFTDDDVEVDALWLDAITAGFLRRADVGCVTGIVPPASLEHPAQEYFDRRYTWAAEMRERVFDLGPRCDASPLYPYSPGIFGTGANFAVDRDLFRALGGFDEALGAGTPAGGGEDLDAFVRVLHAGRTIVYEPAAIGWHAHRCDSTALRRQLFFYGCGLTAFLTKHIADRRTRRHVLSRIGPGVLRLRGTWSPARIGGRAPPLHVVAELVGMGAGPFAYLRGRRLRRRASAAVPAHGHETRHRDLPRLTSLRGVAALLVFAFHIDRHLEWRPASAASQGYVAVSFFFVLSGLILTWTASPQATAWRFWTRRFARVWPSHAATALLALVVPVTVFPVAASAVLPNLLLVHTWLPRESVNFGLNGVSWSLGCEAAFYLAFPALMPLLRRWRRRQRWLVSSAWFAAMALVTVVGVVRGGGAELLTFVNPLVRSGEFVLGITVGLDLLEGHRFPLSFATSALVAFVAGVVARLMLLPDHSAGVPLVPFFAMVLAAAASADLDGRGGWLASRPFVYFGEVSFAFYLVHELVILNLARWLGLADPLPVGTGVAFVTATLVVSFVLAAALHHAIELPAQRAIVGRMHGRRRGASPLPAAGPVGVATGS